MKAVQINKYGDSSLVNVNPNAAVPSPKPGEILIEVHAAGVNPIDYKVLHGYTKDWKPLPFPITLGGDIAGIVSELGEGVTEFKIGDEVYGSASMFDGATGGFAEYASTKATKLALKPKNSNMEEAAALPITGVSAVIAMFDHFKVIPGFKILIHGGAGGIGTMSIQLAKHLGAYVYTTTSGGDTEYVKSLGADESIDYKTQKFEELVKDLDGVYDTIGKDTYERSFQVLKPGGLIVSMIEQPNTSLSEKYNVRAIAQQTIVKTERLNKLNELIEASAIKPHIDKIFPLDQAGAALNYLETGHPRGKVIIKIS